MSNAKDTFNGATNPFSEFVAAFNGKGMGAIATTGDSVVITDNDMKAVDGRTIYMDSNLAVTDGSTMVSDTDNAKAIPSVYHALVGLKEGVLALNTAIGNPEEEDGWETIGDNQQPPGSVAVAIEQLIKHTKNITDDDSKISSVEAFMYASRDPDWDDTEDNKGREQTVILSPGYKGSITGNGAHADESGANTKKLCLKAKDIEFEVEAPTMTGYAITAAGAGTDGTSIPIGSYWIPLNDGGIVGAVDTTGTIVKLNADGITLDGDIISNITVANAPTLNTTTPATFSQDFNRIPDGTVPIQKYTLAAIIEAIQELNRRTMFIDTNMSFHNAILYQDTVTSGVNGAEMENENDGLPGASNVNLKTTNDNGDDEPAEDPDA